MFNSLFIKEPGMTLHCTNTKYFEIISEPK